MATITFRPSATVVSGSGWSVGGGAVDILQAISDASDSTYGRHAPTTGDTYNEKREVDFGTWSSYQSGTVIDNVQVFFRTRANQGSMGAGSVGSTSRLRVNGTEILYEEVKRSSWSYTDGVIYQDNGPVRYTQPTSGGAESGTPWTLAAIDSLQFMFYESLGGLYGGASMDFLDIWIVVTYTPPVPPNTPSSLQRTGENTDTTPNFSAVVSDPDLNTVKARFEIYQNDGVTFVGQVDSPFVASGSTATAEYTIALTVGSYKVRAKAIDSNAMESGWTALVSFNVKASVFKDLIQLWNTYAYVTDDSIYLWDVDAGNVKDLNIKWDVLVTAGLKDLILLWNQKTPWTKLPESSSIWTKVSEL
jgi:hypothetical protein